MIFINILFGYIARIFHLFRYKLFSTKIINLFNIGINNMVILLQYFSTVCIVCIVCIVSANIVKKYCPKMFLIVNGGRC